jgi:hypothetical protein
MSAVLPKRMCDERVDGSQFKFSHLFHGFLKLSIEADVNHELLIGHGSKLVPQLCKSRKREALQPYKKRLALDITQLASVSSGFPLLYKRLTVVRRRSNDA